MSARFAVWVSVQNEAGDNCAWKCTSCGHMEMPKEGTPLENAYDVCPECKAKMMGETSND